MRRSFKTKLSLFFCNNNCWNLYHGQLSSSTIIISLISSFKETVQVKPTDLADENLTCDGNFCKQRHLSITVESLSSPESTMIDKSHGAAFGPDISGAYIFICLCLKFVLILSLFELGTAFWVLLVCYTTAQYGELYDAYVVLPDTAHLSTIWFSVTLQDCNRKRWSRSY